MPQSHAGIMLETAEVRQDLGSVLNLDATCHEKAEGFKNALVPCRLWSSIADGAVADGFDCVVSGMRRVSSLAEGPEHCQEVLLLLFWPEQSRLGKRRPYSAWQELLMTCKYEDFIACLQVLR